MKKKTILLFNIFLLLLSAFAMSQDKYFTKSGRISFFFPLHPWKISKLTIEVCLRYLTRTGISSFHY